MNSEFISETKTWKGISIPWPFPSDAHISELVIKSLKKTPERIVQVSDDEGVEMTCDELRVKIIRVAQHLKTFGINEDDVVGVICCNTIDLMAFVNGIMQLGAIVNPMSVDHSSADLLNMFKQTKPKLVICDADIYVKVKQVMEELENDSTILTALTRIEGVGFADDLFITTGSEDSYSSKKFKNSSRKTIAILSSSGSTGPAKGVCMSQTYYLKFLSLAPPTEMRTLSFSPIFWGSSFGSLLNASLSLETRIVSRKSFTPETFLKIAMKHRVTHFLMNPPNLTLLLQSPLIKNLDTSKVKLVMCLGGIVSEQLRSRFREVFPETYFMIFYGLTELSVTVTFPGQPIDGVNVGFVQPNHEIKIMDDDEKPLGPGEAGEIYARFNICPFMVS